MEDDKWTAKDVFRIAALLVVAGGTIFGIIVGIDHISGHVSRDWLFVLAIPLAWWLIDDLRKERDEDKKKKKTGSSKGLRIRSNLQIIRNSDNTD